VRSVGAAVRGRYGNPWEGLGGGFSGGLADLEPPTLVAGLDDIAVMGQPIEQRRRQLAFVDKA